MLSVSETKQITFGEFLKRKRMGANITQAELSKIVGCSRISISNYESDKREPHISYIVKLANAIQETPSVMLSGFIDKLTV